MMNARFWEWINGDWVKLTVTATRPLRWYVYCRTEEGYHAEATGWELRVDGVVRTTEYSSRDCDGRHGSTHRDFCRLADLAGAPVFQSRWKEAPEDTEGRVIRVPLWGEDRPSRHYDQFAEAAGY